MNWNVAVGFVCIALVVAAYLWAQVKHAEIESRKDSTAKLREQVKELREFQEAQIVSINSAVDAAAKAHAIALEAGQRVGRLEVSASLRTPPLGS